MRLKIPKLARVADIEHLGRVEQIAGNVVTVNFTTQSACASCHAKEACSVSEIQEKVLEIINPGISVKVGEQVWIVLKQSMGFKALFLGYVLPLILLILFLITFTSIFNNEAIGGLLSLFVLAVYYGVLFFARKKIDKQFSFGLRETGKN